MHESNEWTFVIAVNQDIFFSFLKQSWLCIWEIVKIRENRVGGGLEIGRTGWPSCAVKERMVLKNLKFMVAKTEEEE